MSKLERVKPSKCMAASAKCSVRCMTSAEVMKVQAQVNDGEWRSLEFEMIGELPIKQVRNQQAQSAIQGFKRAKDKALARNNIISRTTCKRIGDDVLRYFADGSVLIDRLIVNEMQLFKG